MLFDKPILDIIKDLAVVFGFLKLISEFIVKPILGGYQKNKVKLEKEKESGIQQPILDKLNVMQSSYGERFDELKKGQENVSERLDRFEKKLESNTTLSKKIAKLSLASADETRESKVTNGKTSRACDELRVHLLDIAGEGD